MLAGCRNDRLVTFSLNRFDAGSVAARGPCPDCGSVPFRKPHAENGRSLAPGKMDDPARLRLRNHIYTRLKGGYHKLADSGPQRED